MVQELRAQSEGDLEGGGVRVVLEFLPSQGEKEKTLMGVMVACDSPRG